MGHLDAGKGVGALLCPLFLSKNPAWKEARKSCSQPLTGVFVKDWRKFCFNRTVVWEVGEETVQVNRL